MKTKTKGKAIIGIAMVAIMLASVFAATVPIISAESRGDDYNHIVVQQTPQKVLLGQNLQFDGFDTPVTVTRVSGGDIANIYHADANNRTYNVNWPMPGVYYVNYDSTDETYDAQLSVEEVNMPLKLKVGTELTIDTAGMNLFPEDVVDLIVRGRDGQIRFDTVNNQQFTGITVANLTDWYGDNNLKTAGWTIGAYTFKVKTDDVHACGLEAESVVRALLILKGEIAIEADRTTTIELETVKLAVTGPAEEKIRVEGDSKYVIFKPGIDDTPLNAKEHLSWFNDTIDADGVRVYAVTFSDTGSYTIKVTITAGDSKGDYDTVDITVIEKEVEFDLPSTVAVGDKIDIRGTATSGTYVSIYVDDRLYHKLHNIVIEEDGKFSQEVKTTDVGMNVPGTVRLKAWIDCPTKAGEERPARSPDGEDAILLTTPSLTAELSVERVVQEDDFSLTGTAKGQEVVILSVPPKGGGGKSLLDRGQKGLSPRKASASTTDGTFSKKMAVQEDATSGYYAVYVLSSGMDGWWGTTGEADLEMALNKRYHIPSLTTGIINIKTQREIYDILEDMVNSAGSDDLMVKLRLKVETAYVRLCPIANVAVGDPVIIRGTSNRKERYGIIITCGLLKMDLFHHTVKVENGTFEATLDTTGAIPGVYTVKADDGDGHTYQQDIKIETPYVKIDPASVVVGEPLIVRGASNRQDGFAINVTCEGLNFSQSVIVRNGRFRATFDTKDAVSGQYTVKAGDGQGHVSEAVFTIKPRPTPTPTPKPTATPTPTSAPPGFEAIFAIAGLLAVAYLVHRRKN